MVRPPGRPQAHALPEIAPLLASFDHLIKHHAEVVSKWTWHGDDECLHRMTPETDASNSLDVDRRTSLMQTLF